MPLAELERDFPRAHGAEHDFTALNRLGGARPERPLTRQQPDERTGVEEDLHVCRRRVFPLPYAGGRSATLAGIAGSAYHSRSSSSGIGSKNASVMNVSPGNIGVRSRGPTAGSSTGRSSATGLLRLQMITRSPRATASTYSESFALASAMLTINMVTIIS